MRGVNGLHHITAIAGPAQENLDFYAGVLGMRLVKRSVNQDDPGTYHLFYADAEGSPGSDLTFFPWAHMAPPRAGHGMAMEVGLEVPADSLSYWADRLTRYGAAIGPSGNPLRSERARPHRPTWVECRARGSERCTCVYAVGWKSGSCRTADSRPSRRAGLGTRCRRHRAISHVGPRISADCRRERLDAIRLCRRARA